MALIIETGAIVEGANSYATVDQMRAYALLRRQSVPAANAECEALLLAGMEYIAHVSRGGMRFSGCRVSQDQALDWPRYGAIVDGFQVASTVIPDRLVVAQIIAAIEAQGRTLLPTVNPQAPGPIVESTVGPITTRYSDRGYTGRAAAIPRADNELRPLMRYSADVALVRG